MARRTDSNPQGKEKIVSDSIFSAPQSDKKTPETYFDGFACPSNEKQEQRPHSSPIRSERRQLTFEEAKGLIISFARTNNGGEFDKLPREMKLSTLFTIDKLNNTPLYIALITGMKNAFYDLLDLLTTSGTPRKQIEAYLNIKNVCGRSAVHLGVLSGDERVFNSIIATGAVNYNAYDARLRTIFHYLPETKFRLPEKLRYSKFSVQALNFHDSEGQTPIHIAIERQNMTLLETYVEMGADVRILDLKAQYTPLQYAARTGNIAILKFLLSRSAYGDIDYQSPDGFTALYLAVAGNHIHAIELLLDFNSDPMVLRYGNSILNYTNAATDTDVRSRVYSSIEGDMEKWMFLNSRIDWEEEGALFVEC